ncbi:hypothetical protein HPP92_015493 [Vanilla planifolia]|uniref:GH16 domain-containing protein n=1 Tax=Vanilla planifolia TaxID=51239 RepID=A0A835UVV6_VANPL|nr:hypothetical protein HPP92_015493 [Vanilla planifolia]
MEPTAHICKHFSYVKESTMELTLITHKPLLVATIIVSLMAGARPLRHDLSPPATTKLTGLFPHIPFDDAFSDFYVGKNVRRVDNGSSVDLVLDEFSGSGFKSKDVFFHGFFSAAVKLPPGFAAGVVVAFYMSSSEVFAKNHDEIDFELLGHEKEKEWVLQTNLYGNDSLRTGR